MADEKKQELSLEDLESVGGGVKIDRGDEKRKSSVATASDEESNLRVAASKFGNDGHHVM